ncbi:MAG TPA: hypothetical protein VMV93_02510 [Chloroflexota bacterium]|nr:hypothetical protein [Chloroflexota bacterium]
MATDVAAERQRRLSAVLAPAGVALLTVATAVYLYLLASDTVDGLRGNAQWHLPYISQPANQWWWVPLPAAAAMVVLALSRRVRAPLLAVEVVAGSAFAYLLFAAEWGGGDNLLAKVLNGPTAFWGAAVQIRDLPAALRHYPAFMASVSPSHAASHPPGDMLLFRGLNALMLSQPGWAQRVLAAGRPFISGLPMLLRAGDAPALLAGAIAAIPVIVLLGRLAVAPMSLLAARLGVNGLAASLLFLVLPTTLVHLPLLDTAYPLLSASTVLVAVLAVQRRSVALALAAGVLFGASLLFTAGLLAIGILIGVYALLTAGWRFGMILGVVMLVGWAANWLVLYLTAGINLLAIFNFINHYQQHFEAQRSYWLWVRWKWYDFAMFCGLPLTGLCLHYLVQAIRRWRANKPLDIDRFFVAWACMMVFLWFSPAARAEVGRLWAPMMCFAVLFAARALPRGRWPLATVLLLEIAQVIVINRYLEVINSG